MRLLDLVEQHDLIGSAPHGFGQYATFVIANIPGRRADQTGHGMFLHELRHVDPHHRVLVVEQEFGHGLGQLGLTDTSRPEEQEAAQGAGLVIQAGTRTAHRVRHSFDREVLTNDTVVQLVFHAQQLVPLAFQHTTRGDTRPTFDDAGDLVRAHGLFDHDVGFVLFGLAQFAFKLRDHAIGKLPRFGEVAFALGDLKLGAGTVQLLFQLARALKAITFALPLRSHGIGLFLQIPQLFLQLVQAVLAGSVILFLQRLGFDLKLHDLTIQRIQLFRFAVDFHPQTARGLVHKVDCLVGQETVRDIAMRQGRRRHKGRVADPHTMVQLVLLLNASQDRHRILDRRFADHHRLEPTGKCCVFFDILAVFVQGRRTNAVQFTPCQSRFDEVGRVHRAVRLTGTNQRVHLVNEQDHLARGFGDLGQDGFQPFFELATILCASNQRAHVQRQQALVAQGFGHIAIHDPQGEPLGNRGFTHTGLTNQHRVVLGTAAQHLHGATNFLVPTDDRVDFALAGTFRQIKAVLLERLIPVFRTGRISRAPFPDIIDSGVQPLCGDLARIQRGFRTGFHHRKRHQHAFDRHKAVARFFGQRLCFGQHFCGGIIKVYLRGVARHLGQLAQRQRQGFNHTCRIATGSSNQIARQPLVVIQQCFQ